MEQERRQRNSCNQRMIHDASSNFQPVLQKPNDDWSDDLLACVKWLRSCAKKTFIIEAINNLYPILLLTPKGWSPNTDPSYNLRYKVTPLDDDQAKHPFATEFDVLEWHGVYNWKLFCQYCFRAYAAVTRQHD